MDYHIRIHPKDGERVFQSDGFLHIGPQNGLLVGLFERQYYYIEFSKQVNRIKRDQPLNQVIRANRSPWGE